MTVGTFPLIPPTPRHVLLLTPVEDRCLRCGGELPWDHYSVGPGPCERHWRWAVIGRDGCFHDYRH